MEFKKKILDNGLVIVGEVNRSAKSAAVGFFVKTGSRDETADINGVSHFLEHMVFKGTERLSAAEVNEAFDRTGAKFNAFTSEEMTVFYAAVLPEYLIEVTGLWTELMRPTLREDDFNIEKNVIKEEIAMYHDLPHFDVMDICKSLHFDSHPCGKSVLGTVESIDDLAGEQMRRYFSKRYAPNNMTLAVAGNFEWEQVCSLIEKNCGNWQKLGVERITEDYAGSLKKSRLSKSNLNCEHICLMSQAVSAQDSRRFAALLLASIVGGDGGSRYFWELTDKALAETAAMQFGSMDGTGVFYSYICCAVDKVAVVLETVSNIFKDLSGKGITEAEIQAAKNKALSALVIKNELSMGRLLDLGFNWLYLDTYRAVTEDIDAIKAVTREDICSLIEQLKPGTFTQVSMGPS